MDEQLKALQLSIEEKLKNAVSKPDLERIKADIDTQIRGIKIGVSEEELKAAKSEFDEKLKAQWETTEARLKAAEKKPESNNPFEVLKAAFVAAGVVETEVIEGKEIETLKFDIPDASKKVRVKADMNTAGVTASVATGYQTNYGMRPQQLPASNEVNLVDVFPHMPLAPIERYMAKVVEYDETDGADIKTETTAAGESDFKLKTEDFKVFDFAVKFRVHRNMLRTWTGLQQRIQTVGLDRLWNKIGRFVIDKTAAGNGSTVPYGMLSTGKYTAYDTTLRAHEVKAATIIDVIKNGVLQVALLGTTNEYSTKSVDAIALNPIDIANIESLKDSDNNTAKLAGLVLDATGKLSYVYGLRVISKKYVTENTFILFNQTSNPSIEFGDKFNMEVLIGYDKSEDMSKGILTIQLQNEMAIGLGDPETIVYCSDIATAASDLTIV